MVTCLFVCVFVWLLVCMFICFLFVRVFSPPTCSASLALCSSAGCQGSDATPPGVMDPKPSALGGAPCRTGIMGTGGLLSSPTWWLNSRVEVLQTAHCSGASTKQLTLVTDQRTQLGLPQGVTPQLILVELSTFCPAAIIP